jgi:hypothetical protein
MAGATPFQRLHYDADTFVTERQRPRIQAAIALVGLTFASLARATTAQRPSDNVRLFPSGRYAALDPTS